MSGRSLFRHSSVGHFWEYLRSRLGRRPRSYPAICSCGYEWRWFRNLKDEPAPTSTNDFYEKG